MQEFRDKRYMISFFGVNSHSQNGKAEKILGTYKSKTKIKFNILRKYSQVPSNSPYGCTLCVMTIISATTYWKRNTEKVLPSASLDMQLSPSSGRVTPLVVQYMTSMNAYRK